MVERLSKLDASFLYLEEPDTPMHVGGVLILEAPPGGVDALADLVEARLPLVPRYRQRVAEVVARIRWRFQRGPIPPGLRSYTQSPWLVANDRLKQVGWRPSITNEQAYVEGTEAILEINRSWREAFPDAHGTIQRAVAANGTVTLEITWEGTQSGALQTPEGELPPSNRRVTIKAAEVFDIEDDKVKEAHHYFDMAGMLQQLGVTG